MFGVDQLRLEGGEEARGHGVVPTAARPAQARTRVMDQPWFRPACPQGHLESGGDQLGAEMVGHGPADDLAAVNVEDNGQVQPALVDPDVRDVAEPELIRSRRGELPLDQVLGLDRPTRHRRPSEAPWWRSDQAGSSHQPSHPFARDPPALGTEVGVGTRRAVRAATPLVHGSDLLDQGAIGPGASRRPAMPPGVVAAGRHPQHAARLSE
jgi:hypothetical protein